MKWVEVFFKQRKKGRKNKTLEDRIPSILDLSEESQAFTLLIVDSDIYMQLIIKYINKM